MPHFEEQNYEIDSRLVRRACEKCAVFYQAEVADVIAERLFERLALLKINPVRILDLGAGNARHRHRLQSLYPKATIFSADLSLAMLVQADRGRFWHRRAALVCADAASTLPFANGSFDLVFSNLMLPWVHPPDVFAVELNRILADDGAFFISSAGPDTLMELRDAWTAVDEAAHVNALLDMHDLGDVFLRSGMADPVMDTERLQLRYSTVDKLLDELVSCGALNVLVGRRRGLTASAVRKSLAVSYPSSLDDGIVATFEVVYAHGWKGRPKSDAKGPTEFFIDIDTITRPSQPGAVKNLAK